MAGNSEIYARFGPFQIPVVIRSFVQIRRVTRSLL